MNIHFKVVEIHSDIHSVVARYYTDVASEELLCSYRDRDGNPIKDDKGNILRCSTDVSITFWGDDVPTGDTLVKLLETHIPYSLLELKEKMINPTIEINLSNIEPALHVVATKEVTIDERRSKVGDSIKRRREVNKAGGVQVGDNWYHSDLISRQHWLEMKAVGKDLPKGLEWRTMNGAKVAVTPELVTQVCAAFIKRNQDAFNNSVKHLDAVWLSLSPESYDFSTGWEKTYGE